MAESDDTTVIMAGDDPIKLRVLGRDAAPWHIGAACPGCDSSTGTPQSLDEGGRHWDGRHATHDPRRLWCPACGHAWTEADDLQMCRAWFGAGAWNAHEEREHWDKRHAEQFAARAAEVADG